MVLCDTAKGNFGLHSNQFGGNALLALFKGFANANDSGKSGVYGGKGALVYGDVGFAEILAAFAVAGDNVFNAHGNKHICAYFAGVCARLFPMAVFGADFDIGAVCSFKGGVNVYIRNAKHNRAVGVLYEGFHSVNNFGGFGRSFVHFPVAGDNGFTGSFVHFYVLLFVLLTVVKHTD